MGALDDLRKKQQQQQQQGQQQGDLSQLDKLRQDRKVSSFGFDEATKSSDEAINDIKKAADKNERNRFGILGDIKDTVTSMVSGVGDLIEYGWTNLTNKNKDWGINDYKKYKEYNKLMQTSEGEDEYWDYYQKMIDEGVIDKNKYNEYLNKQKDGKNYEFTQAVEEGKNVFNNKFESIISPIMKQASNRYQIDAISKGISQIEKQYGMAYDSAMNAYNDTRDPRILEEWKKASKEYEEAIINVTEEWAKNIIKGKTYGEAYSDTIDSYANKKLANDIVSLERNMTNKLYKYTLERNFNDAGEYASVGNLFQAVNSTILGAKNLITWGIQQVNFGVEEAKQALTGRYDVTEELANLYVFKEDANGRTKALGSAQWVGNWVLDSLPQLAPAIGEIILTKKLPGGILKKTDKALDAIHMTEGFRRSQFRNISRLLSELAMDNLVYDEAFQQIVGHPITGEEENINLLFNGIIDTAQAYLHVPAKFFNQALKKSDIMARIVSEDGLKLAKKVTNENANVVAEELVLLRGKEITQGTKANKKITNKFWNLDELKEVSPDIVAKYEKLQTLAAEYADRISKGNWNFDDVMLTAEDYIGRNMKNLNDLEIIEETLAKIIGKNKVLKNLGDYVMDGAKSVGYTFREMLQDGRLSQTNLREAIQKQTKVNGMDDLIIGLATGDKELRNVGLIRIGESGEKLTREDINSIYNGAMKDILENNGGENLLKDGEYIGNKYRKYTTPEGEVRFVDVYDKDNNLVKYEDVIKYIDRNLKVKTIGAEEYQITDGIVNAYREMISAIGDGAKADSKRDALPTFQRVTGLGLFNWANKTDAEKKLISGIFNNAGLSMKLDDAGNLLGIECEFKKLEDIVAKMQNMSKPLSEYTEEELGLYRLIYFGNIYESFTEYLYRNKQSAKDFLAKDYVKEFKTYFEKLFDKKQTIASMPDTVKEAFSDLFKNKASFNDIEREAADYLIKGALDGNEEQLYNRIKDVICNGKYFKGRVLPEIEPIVNALYCNSKWLLNMGMSEKTISDISNIFAEVIVDSGTIKALATMNNDYLYTSIISKLILEKEGGAMFKDSLTKLFATLPTNLTQGKTELKRSITNLTKKIEGLSLEGISNADKEAFINKVQKAFEGSQVKLKGGWDKVANNNISVITKGNDTGFTIKNASKLTDEEIDKLSTTVALNTFAKNGLPKSQLLDNLKKGIANMLNNMKDRGTKNISFAFNSNSKNAEAINLSLLGDIKLAQLIRDPDNMLTLIVNKQFYDKNLKGIEELVDNNKLLNSLDLGDEYKKIITGLGSSLDEVDYDTAINELIKAIDEYKIADKRYVLNKVEEIQKALSETNIFKKKEAVDANNAMIEKLENIINILNTPNNSKEAEMMAQRLYETKQILQKSNTFFASNKSLETFQKEMTNSAQNFELLKRFSDVKYKGLLTESPTVREVWAKGTNDIFMDDPAKVSWKGLENKVFCFLDTETTGLEDDADIIQLAYRLVTFKDGKKIVNKFDETYKFDKDKMSSFALENAKNNFIKEGTKTFEEGHGIKNLQNILKKNNVVLVGHNIDADLKWLNKYGVKVPKNRIISTDKLSEALLPITKNHQQDTLLEAYMPIKKAADVRAKEEGVEHLKHHNAIRDTLELEDVFSYLINHSLKNKKTDREGLLDFMVDTSKKIIREKDENNPNKIITKNALPFYRLEHGWSHSTARGQQGIYSIPTILNQFFGSRQSRKKVKELVSEIGDVTKGYKKGSTLNIYDAIDGIADKLSDERSVYILYELKNHVSPDDIIDVNKILIGENVKDAFVEAQALGMSFSEYCTNRLVANILSTLGKYNEETVGAINRAVSDNLYGASLSRFINNGVGSDDKSAIYALIREWNSRGYIELGEKAEEYSKAMEDITKAINDNDLSLRDFNKAIYDYYSNGETYKNNGKKLEYEANNMFDILFGSDGDVKQYTRGFVGAEMNGDYNMGIKEVSDYFNTSIIRKGKKSIDDMEDDLEFLSKKIDEYSGKIEKNRRDFEKGLIDEEEYLSNAELYNKDKKELTDEYNKLAKDIDEANDMGYQYVEKYYDEDYMGDLAPDKDMSNGEIGKGFGNYDYEDEEVRAGWAVDEIGGVEKSDAKRADIYSSEIENQGAAETIRVQGSADNSETVQQAHNDMATIFQEDEFADGLLKGDVLNYSPMYMIDESTETTENYLDTSYNGIIDILRVDDMDKLRVRLENRQKTIKKILEETEGGYKKFNEETKDMSAGQLKRYKSSFPDVVEQRNKYIEANSESNYIYNALSAINGERKSASPEELINIEGFDKNIIGRNTANGKIESVSLQIANEKKKYAGSELEQDIYKVNDAFDYNKDEFMYNFIYAINKKDKSNYYDNVYVDVIYNMTKNGETKPHIQRIKAQNLFRTAVGDKILNDYGYTGKIGGDQYNNLLEGLEIIQHRINYRMKFGLEEGDEGINKWINWETKDGIPTHMWQNWSEDDFIKGLGFSNQKYTEAYKYLDEGQQEKIRKLIGAKKGIKEENFQKKINQFIRSGGRKELDDLYKTDKRNTAEEILYNSYIKPNNKKYKKGKFIKWMNAYVKTPDYKSGVRSHNIYGLQRSIGDFIDRDSTQMAFTPKIEKILKFDTTDDKGINYQVVSFVPIFDVLDGEDNVLGQIEGKFVVDADGRFLNMQESDTIAQQIFGEGVHLQIAHDTDYYTVKLQGSDNKLYKGILDTSDGGKHFNKDTNTIDKDAGTFQLRDIQEIVEDTSDGHWIDARTREVGEIKYGNVGPDRKVNWGESAHEIKFMDATDGYTFSNKVPTDAVEATQKTDKEITKDIDNMAEVKDLDDLLDKTQDVFDVKTEDIWKSRILNFTNYDIINKSEELQQIIGDRQRLLSFHGIELREAIDKFEKIMEKYTDDEQAEVYQKIRSFSLDKMKSYTDEDYAKFGERYMEIDGLDDEVKLALADIAEVFQKAEWTPQIQFAMLSKKNDGFEGVLKNIVHNHRGAAAQYYKTTGPALREQIENLAKEYTSGTQLKNLVGDILGDPLGTGTVNKMVMGLRSLWRFVKYGPILYPLSGVLMLANSAILGVTRYMSESNGLRRLMDSDAFNRLITKKGDVFTLNGKTVTGLGFADGINRVNEIMFNSNSDLGGTWFDKCLDWMINKIPESNEARKRTKEAISVAMKGGTHSLFDLFAQGSVKSMELAKALQKNLNGMSIEEFVAKFEANQIPKETINKILADTEKGYSRFFTNSATSLLSRHKFSRLYMFNALQGYVINRTDEITSSIKDFVNWVGRQQQINKMNYGIKELEGGLAFNWKDFVEYLDKDNQELKGLLMNVLLSAKLGFYMDRLANGGEFNTQEYRDYIVDTSDYLSSIPATFFYGILTAPYEGIEDYAEYVKMNNEDFSIGNGLTVATMNTVSEILSKFFREGKVLNALSNSVVAFGKTGNIDFAYDVLNDEFSNIANGLGRFQLVEGTNKYGLEQFTGEEDLIGQLLFNADKVSNSGKLTNKMYSLQNVDAILNGEDGSFWKDKLLPYIPVLGNLLQNSITGQGYTFTQTKRKELEHIMDTDEVIQILNNWDYNNMEDVAGIWRDNGVFTDDAVGRMYKELTAFNYPYKGRKNGDEFITGYEGELEQIKETVFTDEILRGLNWTDEDLTKYLNEAGDRKGAGLMKIMAAAEASRPGSSKIVISYLANQEEYKLMQQVTGNKYPSTNDLTEEEMTMIQRQVLEDYYPYMFTADKTSWYKAITEYVSNKYPIFENLYKDDDLTGYLSTLGYMDMIMYQQAKEGNVNARYIKNSWSMLSKYFKSEEARINAIEYTMNTIEHSGFSRGKAASAKMGVLAANMDFYDRIQKNGMLNALYGDDIERYNWFVWGVLDEINQQGLNLSSNNGKYYGKKGGYNYNNNGQKGEDPVMKQFVPAAQKYLDGWKPSRGGGYSLQSPKTYKPNGTLDWYRKYYERLIKDYSDKLVKSEGKKYPAQTIEGMTFKTNISNRGSIKGERLTFPKHKSKKYRTNVISNLPGSHG